MADKWEIDKAAELDFLETLYGDPIRGPAMKAGRNLVIGALLLLAVAKFGATVQSTALFPISFTKRPDALPTVLTILVIILAMNFVSRCLPDLLRYREVEVRIIRFIETQKVARARAAARSIDESEPDRYDQGEPDPWWAEVGKVRESAQEATDAVEERLGARKIPRAMRFARVIGEMSVPLVVSFFAVWEAHGAIRW